MKFSDYDMAVCLCVDYRYRTEFSRVSLLMQRFGTKVEPFIDGKGKILPIGLYDQFSPMPPPQWGFGAGAYAHFHGTKAIIRKAKAAGARHLLFLEDDVDFVGGASEILEEANEQLQGVDWDLLYYGANHSEAITGNLSPNVMKVQGSLTTHCFGVKASMFDAILALPEVHVIDNVMANSLHHQFECLSLWPNIAIQRPGYSYLWRKESDYTALFANQGRNR